MQDNSGLDSARVNKLAEKIESLETLVKGVVGGVLPAMRAEIAQILELLAKRRKDYLLVEELADLTGRSAYTIRRWIASGAVQAIRLRDGGPRGRLLIPREEVERLIAAAKGASIPDSSVG